MTAYRCRHKDDDEWSKQVYYYEKPSDARHSFYNSMRDYCNPTVEYIDIRCQKYDDTEEIGSQVIDPFRLKIANMVLQKLDPSCEFFERNRRVMIRFSKTDERTWYPLERLWPAWHGSGQGWGGTWTNHIALLVRWVVGLPVYGLGYWKRDFSARIINLLRRGGYPEITLCVLCNQPKVTGDWWVDDYRTGPCCGMGRCVDKEDS